MPPERCGFFIQIPTHFRSPFVSAARINHQPAFLLSAKPWRENSLRLEMFSRDFGRVSLLARSARTRGSELRGILVPFVPVSVSWYGKEELKTLHRAEWLGGWRQPQPRDVFSGLYVNELLLKLTAREDALPTLYDAVYAVMQGIADGGRHLALLRHFEWRLLSALGLAPDWQYDEHGAAVQAADYYLVRAEMPVCRCTAETVPPASAAKVSGGLLLQLGQDADLSPAQTAEAMTLMRLLLAHYLPEGIASRRVLQQLQDFKCKIRQNHPDTSFQAA